MPQVAAIILAAGLGRRMGGTTKMVIDLGGRPMVRIVAETALATEVRPVIVVVGHQADRVRTALAGLPLTVVDNPDYRQGLSSSVAAGVAALPGDVEAALILLGDMPRVTTAHIDQLCAAFAAADGRSIFVPTHRGRRGNPVLWHRRWFDDLARVHGDRGGRGLIAAHPDAVCEVDVADRGVVVDLDRPEQVPGVSVG